MLIEYKGYLHTEGVFFLFNTSKMQNEMNNSSLWFRVRVAVEV